jgi:hypothetical protein
MAPSAADDCRQNRSSRALHSQHHCEIPVMRHTGVPRVPIFRETMTKENQWTAALFGDVNFESVRVDGSMLNRRRPRGI